jgi:hypothetical protein
MIRKLILVLAILALTATHALARGGGGFHGGGFHGSGGFHGGFGGGPRHDRLPRTLGFGERSSATSFPVQRPAIRKTSRPPRLIRRSRTARATGFSRWRGHHQTCRCGIGDIGCGTFRRLPWR